MTVDIREDGEVKGENDSGVERKEWRGVVRVLAVALGGVVTVFRESSIQCFRQTSSTRYQQLQAKKNSDACMKCCVQDNQTV